MLTIWLIFKSKCKFRDVGPVIWKKYFRIDCFTRNSRRRGMNELRKLRSIELYVSFFKKEIQRMKIRLVIDHIYYI